MSVVTLAELLAGVLAARDTQTRARRLATLEVLNDIEILPVDAEVGRVWAHLSGFAGRSRSTNQCE